MEPMGAESTKPLYVRDLSQYEHGKQTEKENPWILTSTGAQEPILQGYQETTVQWILTCFYSLHFRRNEKEFLANSLHYSWKLDTIHMFNNEE